MKIFQEIHSRPKCSLVFVEKCRKGVKTFSHCSRTKDWAAWCHGITTLFTGDDWKEDSRHRRKKLEMVTIFLFHREPCRMQANLGWLRSPIFMRMSLSLILYTSLIPIFLLLTSGILLMNKTDLQALYLNGTYCQKTGTRTPSCTTPQVNDQILNQ